MLSIQLESIHLWQVVLSDFFVEENHFLHLLSADELLRTKRFRFDLHRQRYVIARGALRKIVSQYIGILPEKIVFRYGEQGKPYLADNKNNQNKIDLRFNLSHSENIAVYAISVGQEVGVDIEKMREKVDGKVAKRFFNEKEYADWESLLGEEKVSYFYDIWTKKEAVIKLLGCGLMSMSQLNLLDYDVVNISVPEGYRAALVAQKPIKKVSLHFF